MEPGIAAAAYTVETAVEGVAVGALAIAKSTVPLKARFYRLPAPSPSLKRHSHTLNVVRGKAYIFGGDGEEVGKKGDNAVHVVTLPTDLELRDTDYQKIPAVAEGSKVVSSTEEKSDEESGRSGEDAENVPAARAGHCCSAIGERIYIFGGSSPRGTSDPTAAPNAPLEEDGKVYVFNTMNKTWGILTPNRDECRDGLPLARNYASSCSTVHPLPITVESGRGVGKDELMTEEAKLRLLSKSEGKGIVATEEQQSEGYGTLFIHGGYDSDWNLLRDVWAFDVGSRIWSRWPDLPEANVDAGEGNILCFESRLWRCGDGFGKVAHLDIVRDTFDDMGGKGELAVSPKTGEWEVHTFGVKPGFEETEKEVEKKMGGKPTNADSLFPEQRKRAGFVSVTSGQGREYLLLLMGEKGPHEVMNDVWSFQIASEQRTAAALKDKIRTMIGRKTGEEQWAKADVLESSKEDGILDVPKGLSRFGSSSGGDWIGNVVLWGGIGPGGETSGDGWILTLE